MAAHNAIHIDFLYWEECPSHDEALARLKEVLAEEQIEATVRLIHVATAAEAHALRFPGSPTIRLNGQDLFDMPAGMVAGLTCRVYYADDGRVTPLPSKEMIRQAIRRWRRNPVGRQQ